MMPLPAYERTTLNPFVSVHLALSLDYCLFTFILHDFVVVFQFS